MLHGLNPLFSIFLINASKYVRILTLKVQINNKGCKAFNTFILLKCIVKRFKLDTVPSSRTKRGYSDINSTTIAIFMHQILIQFFFSCYPLRVSEGNQFLHLSSNHLKLQTFNHNFVR